MEVEVEEKDGKRENGGWTRYIYEKKGQGLPNTRKCIFFYVVTRCPVRHWAALHYLTAHRRSDYLNNSTANPLLIHYFVKVLLHV